MDDQDLSFCVIALQQHAIHWALAVQHMLLFASLCPGNGNAACLLCQAVQVYAPHAAVPWHSQSPQRAECRVGVSERAPTFWMAMAAESSCS